MKPKFPHIWNGAKAKCTDDKLTFTYIDSYGEVINETKPKLSAQEICDKTVERHHRFGMSGPGSRESEISRAERKWISAHDESLLREAWDLLDDDGKMEFSMMLSMDSHHGISSPKWAKQHAKDRENIIGDNQVPL